MLFYLLGFCGNELETKCCISSLVYVVYIGIYTIGYNIYTKCCLLKCHNLSNYMYLNVPIEMS